MSTELARPLVPTGREQDLGREAEAADFSDHRIVVPAFDPFAGERPATWWGRRKAYIRSFDLREVEGPMLPLIVLALLGLISKFALDAGTLLQPDIQESLGIDLSTAVTVIALTNTPFTVLRLWIGYAADRLHRVWMLRISALVRAGASFMVAGAGGLPLYTAGQVGQGAALTVGEPATLTLLSDYYPVQARTRVIFLLFQITSIGGILAYPVVGLIGGTFGWRWVFVGLGGATVLVLLLSLRMKEPVRGYWERKELGADDSVALHEQAPLSFAEGFRTAWSIRYLRVLCLAAPFLSVTSLYSLVIQQNYLASVYGLGATARGFITMLTATSGTIGLLVVAPFIGKYVSSSPRTVVMIQALQGLLGAGIYMLLLLVHNTAWAVTVLSIESLITLTVFPITFSLQNLVVPPRMKGFGFQVNQAFGAFSVLLLTFGISRIAAQGTWTTLFIIIAAVNLAVAVIVPTALPYIESDIANAQISSLADEELRQHRASGQTAMLLCRKVDVAYSGVKVLFGVDLTVSAGEVVALLGTNGAGKSTLLRAIAGVHEPTGGVIFLDGVDVTHKPPHESAAAGIVVVPGGRAVCHSLTVRENLKLAAWLKRKDHAYVAERTAVALDLFPRLQERLDTEAGNLSGGEQQMLAIAQAYLMEPRLLMIDELSLGLAPQVVEDLLESIRAINATGTTVLLVEQSINVALTIAKRAIFMDKGEIRFDGSTDELLSRPDLVRSVFMGGAASSGRSRRRALTGVSATGEPLLRVSELSVRFGRVNALTDVELEVAPREIVGIIGPNGAGKTTLFDAISGLVPTVSGSVEIKGVDVSRLTLDARAAAGLGRSFQSARLFPALTVRENIAVAMQKRIKSRNPLLAALWAPPVRRAEHKVRERVDDIIELLGLNAYADKFVGELSTGSRRAVDVGCIMVSSPDLLLLDEPSSGLAQAETEALGPLIQRIVRETGCGVLLIEHDLPLISSVSDRLIAMELGQVIASGLPVDVVADPEVRRAYLSASREVLLRSDSTFGAALAAAGLSPDSDSGPTS